MNAGMKKGGIFFSVLVLLFLLFSPPPSPAGKERVFTVTLEEDGQALVLKQKGERKWKAILGDETWTLKRKSSGKFVAKWGGEVVAKGKLRDNRLKLKDPYGYEYAKIKFKGHKIKVYLVSSYSYDLKPRENQWKVLWGDMDLGVIEKKDGRWEARGGDGGLKAAVSRDCPPLVLAPFLMDGVDRPKRVVLALVFLALGERY